MNVSNSSLASYYVGNTALQVDPRVAKRSQEVVQSIQQAKEVRSKPSIDTEHVIEGELLNKKRGVEQGLGDDQNGREFFAKRMFAQQPQEQTQVYRSKQAINEYQATAQINSAAAKHLDLYV